MPLELLDLKKEGEKSLVCPGDQGLLVLARVRGLRNVHREALKKLRAIAELYYKDKCPESKDIGENGGAPVKVENGEDTSAEAQNASSIKFSPYDIVYQNCIFFFTNIPDPSDFVYFAMSQMAEHPEWPQPRFPLRIMPVQVVSRLNQKAIESAVTPLLEQTFGGEEPVRFSFILHSKKPSMDMTLHQAEAIVRNSLWSINPNCVQCLKYQDYAVMIEIIDPLILIGIAKAFNQLGRYNTATVHKGRDLKDQMDDSEDDISDDPNLSEDGNIKRKLDIKRKRRQEKAELNNTKQAKNEEDEQNKDENAGEVQKNPENANDHEEEMGEEDVKET